jgi:hypothetical protein
MRRGIKAMHTQEKIALHTPTSAKKELIMSQTCIEDTKNNFRATQDMFEFKIKHETAAFKPFHTNDPISRMDQPSSTTGIFNAISRHR